MASCKECIHFDVCMDYTNLKESKFAQDFNETDILCEHYKATADVEEVVHCVDCEYLMFSDMYGECGKAILGIVSPHDFCSRGQRRRKGGRP